MGNANKALTKGDLKGGLLQRLECATCTRKLAQVESFDVVQLDKAETREPGSRRAVTVMCDECQKLKRVPVRSYRYVMPDVIGEAQIEDLPDLGPGPESNQAEDDEDEAPTKRGRARG